MRRTVFTSFGLFFLPDVLLLSGAGCYVASKRFAKAQALLKQSGNDLRYEVLLQAPC